MPRKPEFDCTRCGACCYNLSQNHPLGFREYIAVATDDPIANKPKLARRFVIYNDQGEGFMRLDREQRCTALRGELGRSVECSVYEDRPAVCRRFEAGSEGCLKSRAERGITE